MSTFYRKTFPGLDGLAMVQHYEKFKVFAEGRVLAVAPRANLLEEGTMFILTLHPYLSGHRAPMQHLNQFVGYMKSKPGVWFATAEQIARYVKDPRGQ